MGFVSCGLSQDEAYQTPGKVLAGRAKGRLSLIMVGGLAFESGLQHPL